MDKARRAPWNCWAVVVALLALGACSQNNAAMDAPPPPPPATEQPETVMAEAYVETEATIETIDQELREVTLLLSDGTPETVTVQDDVDLTKLSVGQIVILQAYERMSVRALPAGSAALGARRTLATARPQPGAPPGRAGVDILSVVMEVASVDVARNTVTLRSADGSLRMLDVTNPDNQRKLKTLKVGDLVEFQSVNVGAVQLKPKP